jgi:protein-S-isoprenylcysteine O-methyltransferase Ste14
MFRWIALIVLVGSISISAYHRRRARAVAGSIPRSRESGLLIAGRLLIALPLFGGALAYVCNPGWMAWSSFDAPSWLRWTGVALGVATLGAVRWVLGNLGRNVSETVLTKSGQELVTSGPYRWIRHPLYTTGILLFTSLGLIAANWFILLFAAIALLGIRLGVIPTEERELIARFGSDYEAYRARTGAMWPRMRADG